jgi:hypothetical protein
MVSGIGLKTKVGEDTQPFMNINYRRVDKWAEVAVAQAHQQNKQ